MWCADDSGFAEAVAAASASDVVIACVGLNPGTNAATGGAEGEMMDRASLALLGKQEKLLAALKATGKPLIVVLLNGGQVTTEPWQEGTAAVIEVQSKHTSNSHDNLISSTLTDYSQPGPLSGTGRRSSVGRPAL